MPQQGNRQKDPRQLALRNQKKQWSASVSALISKLIEYKKGLNGRGSAKIGIEPSKIQNPLPESVSSALSQLTADFSKIVSDAEQIIAAQQNYSATRRKRQPKKPKAPQQPNVQAPAPTAEAPATPEAPAENPLARIGSFNAEIEKLASNKLTRFWQYLTSVFSRKEYNRHRLGMLSLSAKLFYDMLDFENSVLRTGEKTIPDTMNKFQNMKNTYIALRKLFENVAKTLADKAKKEGVKPPVEEAKPAAPEQKPTKPQVINLDEEDEDESDPNGIYINQLKHNINILNNKKQVEPKNLQEIVHMINEYQNEKDPHAKDLWLKQIREEYNNLMFSLKNKKADIFNDNMIKVSHNALTRFLRKQLVKAKSYDKTAAPRLQAADLTTATKKTIKRLMDVLEKDLSVEEVSKLLGEIENKIIEIGKLVSILSVLYKERFSGEHHESDKDLNVALRRRVRRDLLQGMM
jgi:hypothetical protein